jgi:glycine/D-amino acid oxidase-like deaminating enzyme
MAARDVPQARHGGFIQRRTGHLDLPALLKFMGKWLRERDALVLRHVEAGDIQPLPDRVKLGPYSSRHLVFCNGYRAMEEPWFGDLPFAPDKGEFLVLEAASEQARRQLPRRIINGAHWMLLHADGFWRLGSTHDDHHRDQQPTKTGKEKLLRGLAQLLLHPEACRIRHHQAGVRPATADRQPLLGTHPRDKRLHLFNGFGAHGSLSIPWYSERMVEWLLEGVPLPRNADTKRFSQPSP